jgi:cyclic di-GMP phosphodiesterase
MPDSHENSSKAISGRGGDLTIRLNNLLACMDDGMRNHSERVAAVAAPLAQAVNLADEEIRNIVLGALLHEVGKLDIPEAILRKRARLSREEMLVMREYCFLGYERVRQIPALAEAAEIVYAHREKFNGSGYPRGLKGETIPLGARIVAVACAFETFVSDRPHASSRASNHARAEISRWSGSCFDPAVVEVVLGLQGEVLVSGEMRTAAP